MLLIDKPVGISSFDVIRRLRRVLDIEKMGHAGTLDPLASGLMLVALGAETKTLSEYIGLSKTYEVTVLIGERRSTGDMEGEVTEQMDVPELTSGVVRKVLDGMTTTLRLPVPAHSAIKQGGESLYKKVRRGEDVERPVRPMTIHGAMLRELSCTNGSCRVGIALSVSSGTYIRSIAEELGIRLGYPATTAALRRTQIGEFDIKNALALDDERGIKAIAQKESGEI